MAKSHNIDMAYFNPQFDFLLKFKNGQQISSVFGRMYRYCQMNGNDCHASVERMADEINMDSKTFRRWRDWLERFGLIYDTTPNAGRNIHTYKVNEELLLRLAEDYVNSIEKQKDGWIPPEITLTE